MRSSQEAHRPATPMRSSQETHRPAYPQFQASPNAQNKIREEAKVEIEAVAPTVQMTHDAPPASPRSVPPPRPASTGPLGEATSMGSVLVVRKKRSYAAIVVIVILVVLLAAAAGVYFFRASLPFHVPG